MATTERYPIRVDPAFRALFAVLGAPAHRDFVEVDDDGVHVRLGWLFRADFTRSAVVGAQLHPNMYGGWGAHGWSGRWLVNGSSAGIVRLDLEPRQRGWLLGAWPVSLVELDLSLVDPEALVDRLAA